MRLRDMLLTSALSGSLALYPLGLHAQTYDTWTLNREVLNSAANYTGVLTSAHRQVRKYITWQWNTSLSEVDQQQRTEDILSQISNTQQISDILVPSLNMDVLAGYDVRFRYCDSKLLSYFDGTGFKHGLSAQQIVDAPVLRAQRADTTFYGEPLGIVKTVGASTVDDPTENGRMMLQTYGGRNQTIPACMSTDDGGALAEGTVAYMTSAAQKFGVARTRRNRETRKLPCAGRQVGSGIKQERFKSTDYNAQGDPLYNAQSTIPYDPEDADFNFSYLDTATAEGDGHWKTKVSHCRAPATVSLRLIDDCPNNPSGSATYEVFRTEAYDKSTAAFREQKSFAATVWLPSDEDGHSTRDAAGNPTVIKLLIPHLSFCEGAPDRLTLEPDISHRTETQAGQCPATHPYGTVTEARTVEVRRWSFADSPDVEGFDALREVTTEIEGPWGIDDDRCYRRVNQRSPETKVSSCTTGYTGSVSYQREKTVTGVDWRDPKWVDPLSTSHSTWRTASNTCRPKPTPTRGCAGIYSEKALDRCHANNPRNNRGGGGRDGGGGSDHHPRDGHSGHGQNGPPSGWDGGGGAGNNDGGRGRVICTELWRQGLVSRELAVMDMRFTAERLTPAHYRGYHAWAIPVVHKMRQSTRWTAVWKLLAVARMNEIAWQLGKADSPDYLGKIVRHTLEPLSYIIGLFVGESDIAAFERKARNRKEISHV